MTKFRRQAEQDAYRFLLENGLTAFEDKYPREAIGMVNDWSDLGFARTAWKWDGTYEEPANSRGVCAKRIVFMVRVFRKYLDPKYVR